MVAEYVEALGARPESTVFGFGFKAPAPWAAFVNGSLGHMLDYDDVGAGGHVGIATVPVAFAVAEKLGHVSGRDLIAAIRAGKSTERESDPALPSTMGTYLDVAETKHKAALKVLNDTSLPP